MSEMLKRTMQQMVQLTDPEFGHILSFFEKKRVAKKEHVLKAGSICNVLNYCEKGCFRNYFVNQRGEEIVVDFAWEDYWVGDLYSLVNRMPSKYNLQALENAELLGISFSDFQSLCREIPQLQQGLIFRAQRNNSRTLD